MKNHDLTWQIINGDAWFVSVEDAGNVMSLTDDEIEKVHDWIIDGEYIKVISYH